MAKHKKPAPAWRQIGFQLNQNDIEDNKRLEVIDWLRANRKKNTVLRKGLDIVYALEFLNDVTPLLQAFPNIALLLNANNGALLQSIYDQQTAIIAKLDVHSTLPAPVTGKTISMAAIAMPTFDDEDMPTIEIKRDTTDIGAQVTANFLDNAFALHGE